MACFDVDQTSTSDQFELVDAFLHRTTSNTEEVLAVSLRETTIAFGDVRRNGEGGSVELIDQKSVTTSKLLSGGAYSVCKVDGLLIDEEFSNWKDIRLTFQKAVSNQ